MRFIHKIVTLLTVFLSYSVIAIGQQPHGIDPSAASDQGTLSEMIWNIAIFGVLPLIAVLIYLIVRNQRNNFD